MILARGCVAVVLLTLLSVVPASAQCVDQRIHDTPFRQIAYDIALDGDDIWVATSHGVALWARESETARPVASIAVPGSTIALVTAPGGVWAASGESVYFIRKSPLLSIVSSLELEGTINDLLVHEGFLFAATTAGITQADVFDPADPVALRELSTTAGSALSLALAGDFLYAADGDRTIEVYSVALPTLPQQVGTVDSLAQSLSVRRSGNFILVSDGIQTEVFSGTGASLTRLALVPFGATAAAPLGTTVHAIAGPDRAVRIVDLLATVPTVLATLETDSTPGTVNRIGAIEIAGGELWVAGGDAGLRSWSLEELQPPYPLRSVDTGATSSAWDGNGRIIVAPASGGLRAWSDISGQLTPGAQWAADAVWTIHDGENLRILASSGPTLALFDATQASPPTLSSATLQANIRSAVLTTPSSAIAVLVDGSVWRVDLAQSAGTVASAGAPQPQSFVARGGGALALAQITAAGSTVIRYFASGDPASAGIVATIEGASNGGIAVSGDGIVAASTFRGLTLIDFTAGASVTVVPGTNSAPVRDITFDGSRLVLATSDRIEVRSADGGALISSIELPSSPSFVHAAGGRAVATTANGFSVLLLDASSRRPAVNFLPATGNRFYRGIRRDGEQLWLAERERIDLYSVGSNGLPRLVRAIDAGEPFVDFAASGGLLFTVSTAGAISGRDATGATIAGLVLEEGSDQQISAMHAVGGALWVSLTRGCLTTGCEKRTVIVDARSGLSRTGSFDGAVIDVSVRGTKAVALTDLPREIRVYDVSDPAHPSLLVSRASEGNPVSADLADGIVWTLGDHLYSYDEASLLRRAQLLAPWTSDPTGRVSYLDQEVRVLGGCLLVVGRGPAPRRFAISGAGVSEVAAPPASGAIRGVAVSEGEIHLLGESSIEVWSTLVPAPRRRAVKR